MLWNVQKTGKCNNSLLFGNKKTKKWQRTRVHATSFTIMYFIKKSVGFSFHMSAPRLFVLFFYFIFVFLNSQLQWLYIKKEA